METKKCTKCDEVKCVNNFAIRDGGRQGRNSWCILCERRINQEYYKKKKDEKDKKEQQQKTKFRLVSSCSSKIVGVDGKDIKEQFS